MTQAEPIDFEQIATALLSDVPEDFIDEGARFRDDDQFRLGKALFAAAIIEQLRQVWNARGTADEDAVFGEFGGPTSECLRAAGAIRMLELGK